MAVDMFLKLSGVTGESKDRVHTQEIDILSWDWGMSNFATGHVGGGAGAGKVSVQDLRVSKRADNSSPNLLLFCVEGEHFDAALLTVRKAGGQKPVEYLKFKLETVFITGVSVGCSHYDDSMIEHVSLNFAKVSVDYTPQDEKGMPLVAIPFAWDIAANNKG
jgi:type VI secretion system secreted protein Hcp